MIEKFYSVDAIKLRKGVFRLVAKQTNLVAFYDTGAKGILQYENQNLHLQTLSSGKEQGEPEHKEADKTLLKPPTPPGHLKGV